MKIAYLVDEDMSHNSGVSKKIVNQVKIWKSFGHEILIYSIRNNGIFNFESASSLKRAPDNLSGFRKLQRHFSNVKRLASLLKNFGPDLIYLRYIKYAPGLISTLKSNAPYIIELNSDDSVEFGINSFSIGLYNKCSRGALLKNAAGFISVTSELKSSPSFAKFNVPTVVIGNGFSCDRLTVSGSTRDLKDQPQMVFVGSPNMNWHGLDKIYYLATKLPEFLFHIVGPDKSVVESITLLPKNIRAHGYLTESEIEKLCLQCDVGISTLALHRNNMKEACPLKSRQYLAIGLPIIIGYEDPDLPSELDFVLNIGNTEENVNKSIHIIKEFVYKMREIDSLKIQEFAKKNLDYFAKERTRCSFFDSVINREKISNFAF